MTDKQPEALQWADDLDNFGLGPNKIAALLRTQHAAIERKDALLRQALGTLENSRSLEPVDVDWVKGERHSIISAIIKELSQ